MSGAKRFQHRFGPGIKGLFPQPTKQWALCIASAIHHGDVIFATRLMILHPRHDWRSILRGSGQSTRESLAMLLALGVRLAGA